MASFKIKRVWDEIWKRLNDTVETPFGASLVINEPLTLYVATNGSDVNGKGSLESPFATVQGALAWLEPYTVQSEVTISIGEGTFPPFYFNSARFKVATTARASEVTTVGAAGVNITGTTGAPTLTTGTSTGSSTASIVTNNINTVTDSGQNWTVNELAGKLVVLSSSPTLTFTIVSNTATTFDIMSTSARSGTYTITTQKTIIKGDGQDKVSRQFPSTTSGAASTSEACIVVVADNTTHSIITLQKLYVDATNVACGVSLAGRVTFTQSYVTRTGTGTNTRIARLDDLAAITTCYLVGSGSGIGVISAGGANLPSVSSSVVSGATTGLSGCFGTLSGNYITGSTTGLSLYSPTTSIPRTGLAGLGSVFNTCTTGVAVGSSMITGGGLVAWAFSDSTNWAHFQSCGTVATINGPNIFSMGTFTGSSNTTGIVATKGAKVQISSGSTLGVSGTELSVDGVTSTLATMRAASPKTFPTTANPYGTVIYE